MAFRDASSVADSQCVGGDVARFSGRRAASVVRANSIGAAGYSGGTSLKQSPCHLGYYSRQDQTTGTRVSEAPKRAP